MPSPVSLLSTTRVDEQGRKHVVAVLVSNPEHRKQIGQVLMSYGLEALEVQDAKSLLPTVAKAKPSAIILDTEVPGTDGFEVCMELKKSAAARLIPVVFVTADHRPELMLCAFEAGGADYIRKDGESLELIARLWTHIEIFDLQKRLARNQASLAKQLKAVNELMNKEQVLRERVEQQQTQMMQAEKMASIGQLAAGVAHEINNPTGFVASNLSSLAGYIEDMKSVIEGLVGMHEKAQAAGVLPEQVKQVGDLLAKVDLPYLVQDIDELIDESLEGTKRIRQIVADLRDFSHVDSPDLALEDINQLIEKTLNVAHNEIKYKAQVETHFGELPEVTCFGGRVGQVLLNLFVNAAHAISEQGKIVVRTGVVDTERVWIEIEDTGSGIPEENIGRIFDPFFTTKDVGKGTGLGLHLAYQTMQSHEGDISVKSVVGEGTTFRLELPIKGPKAEAGESEWGGHAAA